MTGPAAGTGPCGQNPITAMSPPSSASPRLSRSRASSWRRAGALGTVGIGVAVLAGCGSSPAKPYALGPTKTCLARAGAKILPVTARDIVASSALDGAFTAKLAMNKVTLSFSRDESGASLIQSAYTKYGSRDVPIDQVLDRRNNVVLLWAGAPTSQDAAVVQGCLKS